MPPVPPLVIGKVPVTPGVISLLPLKLALVELFKFVLIFLSFCKVVAVALLPIQESETKAEDTLPSTKEPSVLG